MITSSTLNRAAEALAVADLDAAERELALAMRWSPADPALYALRAQVNMQQGEVAAAVTDLEQALRLSPTSQRVLYNLALAYETAGRYDDADAAWRGSGVGTQELEQLGDAAFDQGAYGEAYSWYHRAARLDAAREPVLLFRLAATSVLAGHESAPALLDQLHERDPQFQVAPLSRAAATRIDGAALHWLLPRWGFEGKPLSYASNQTTTGFFFWNGAAIAVFDVREPGAYLLRVQLRHSVPPPVQMAIGLNNVRLAEVSLDRGDNSWTTVEVPLRLEAGLNAAQLWFLNNAATAQGDRDAAVAWLELAPVR